MLQTHHGSPELLVRPESRWPVARCEIFYSIDPDPKARFWRSTDWVRDGDTLVARLPLESTDTPLFAFANVHYRLPQAVAMPASYLYGAANVREVCLSSALHWVTAAELRAAKVSPRVAEGKLIAVFPADWRDWYVRAPAKQGEWQHWTRKLTDPRWRGKEGTRLALTLQAVEDNQMKLVLIENERRTYRGPRKTFVCTAQVKGGAGQHIVTFSPGDFKNTLDGQPLGTWLQVDVLGLCSDFIEVANARRMIAWRGPAPEFRQLEWKQDR